MESCDDVVAHFSRLKAKHVIKGLSLSGTRFVKVVEVRGKEVPLDLHFELIFFY